MKTIKPNIRTLLASVAVAAAIALAGCDTDGMSPNSRALKPLSEKILSQMADKNMAKDSPILVRLFKEESELEVWKQDRTGRFEILKTYPICRWSGDLGPKIKEGDRQAPEGFYNITPGQMNPRSQYYLAFNMGYPNAYDKAWGHTGAELMVHGDCSSRGCYAMTDEQITEIYGLGRESFFGGQKAFQVQAYPFRMTALNMAKHRNNPNMAFWKMIKTGSDHFEVSHQQPKVDVCEKHYVFDAQAPGGGTQALNFSPAGRCPAYEVPHELADAVAEKERADNGQFAALISRGTPTAPIKSAADGGMNPVFLAALKHRNELKDANGNIRAVFASESSLPGTIPPTAVPPEERAIQLAEDKAAYDRKHGIRTVRANSLAATDERPTQVASAEAPGSSSLFSGLFSSIGLRGDDNKAPAIPGTVPVPRPNPRLTRLHGPSHETAHASVASAPAAESVHSAQASAAHGAIRPSARTIPPAQTATVAPAAAPVLAAQPEGTATSFDSRFAFR